MNDVALQQPSALAVAPLIPGARPLRNPAHERYARERSLLLPRVEAYRLAGLGGTDHHADRGNAAKLERKRAVLDRIAYLSRQPEEVLAANRARLEAFLWAAHETNYAEYFEAGSMSRLKPFSELSEDQQRMIESLKFTEKGRPILMLYSRMQANIELRKLLGIGRVERDDDEREFDRLGDAELFAEIAREAKELGIDVEFTFRANGSAA